MTRATTTTLALCAAFAVLLPFASTVTVSNAAHPHLVGLFPAPFGLIGAGLFAAVMLAIAVREIFLREPLAPTPRAGLLFAGAAVLGSLAGFDPLPGTIAALLFGTLPFVANAALRVAGNGSWRVLAAAFLWSGIVVCALALAAMVLRRPVGLYAFAHGRAIGMFANPNELAEFALAVAAVGIANVLAGTQRALGWTGFALATLTLAATGSRSGEAAFGIGAVVLLAGLRPRRGVAALVVLVALAGLFVAFGLDSRRNPAENDTRLAAWKAGIRTVALFPLTGVGIGAYYRVYPLVRGVDAPGPGEPIAYDPHNFYLSVAAETGLLGLAALGWVIVRFAGDLRAALAGADPASRRFALATAAGLAAIACHLTFNAFALTIPIWTLLAALALGAARCEYRAP